MFRVFTGSGGELEPFVVCAGALVNLPAVLATSMGAEN